MITVTRRSAGVPTTQESENAMPSGSVSFDKCRGLCPRLSRHGLMVPIYIPHLRNKFVLRSLELINGDDELFTRLIHWHWLFTRPVPMNVKSHSQSMNAKNVFSFSEDVSNELMVCIKDMCCLQQRAPSGNEKERRRKGIQITGARSGLC